MFVLLMPEQDDPRMVMLETVQFVRLTVAQQLLISGRLSPYEWIPGVNRPDLIALKRAGAPVVDAYTLGALVDHFGIGFLDSLRELDGIPYPGDFR